MGNSQSSSSNAGGAGRNRHTRKFRKVRSHETAGMDGEQLFRYLLAEIQGAPHSPRHGTSHHPENNNNTNTTTNSGGAEVNNMATTRPEWEGDTFNYVMSDQVSFPQSSSDADLLTLERARMRLQDLCIVWEHGNGLQYGVSPDIAENNQPEPSLLRRTSDTHTFRLYSEARYADPASADTKNRPDNLVDSLPKPTDSLVVEIKLDPLGDWDYRLLCITGPNMDEREFRVQTTWLRSFLWLYQGHVSNLRGFPGGEIKLSHGLNRWAVELAAKWARADAEERKGEGSAA
ncbi:hypothetical protein QBC35DRAFT_475938 [Podospora australis]|uniref:Uncharacterized protein n=1 Tax=Podospora australis TaxID=1536484 RepID=A0AAN7AH88_9PEZI|nr:hypothetical protein QBC35DRAFT_475938 [Podospora australis]